MARLFNSVSRVFFGDTKSARSLVIPSENESLRSIPVRNSRQDVVRNILGMEKKQEKNKKSKDIKVSRNISHTGKMTGLRALHSEKDINSYTNSKHPIFGAPLKHLEMSKNKYPNVPRFVVDCIEYIEWHYINTEGIYRVSGNVLSVSRLRHDLVMYYDVSLFKTVEVNTLTSLLKLFFREMNESLIPQEACKIYLLKSHSAQRIEALRNMCTDMREPNRSTLRFLIKHLAKVGSNSSENRMTAYNLATVWGPSILWVDEISDIRTSIEIVKILIQNHLTIFKDIERKRFR